MKPMRKISAILITCALMTVGISFGLDNQVAAGGFIETIGNTGLPGGPDWFTPEDVAWNAAGTMAIVVGHDNVNGPNAYAFWPGNETWYPLSGYNGAQTLTGVDCHSGVYIPTPRVMIVNADTDLYDGQYVNVENYFNNTLQSLNTEVYTWDVYGWSKGAQGKPTATDMAGYDVVIWICSGYMDISEFDSNDQSEVETYLDNGGNFIFGSLSYSDWYGFGLGSFGYDYLGVGTTITGNSDNEYYANGSFEDEVFGDFGQVWLDWNNYGWSGHDSETDEFSPSYGTVCFWGYEDFMNWDYRPIGVRYDSGSFKTIYCGFPLETFQNNDLKDMFEMALEWFVPGSQIVPEPADVLLVDADYYGDDLWMPYNWSLSNNSAEVTIWDVYGNHGTSQGKPSSSDMAPYNLVVWVETRTTEGEGGSGDAFNTVDEGQVANYLDAGGNFFLANTQWSEFTQASMGVGDYMGGDFAYDYFGIDNINTLDSNYENYVTGEGGDDVFDGFGNAYHDWNKFGWPGGNPMTTDRSFNPVGGSDICMFVSDYSMISDTGGVKYDQGTYKTMFMGFPLETLQYPHTDDFWNRTLEWFIPGSTTYEEPDVSELVDTFWICGDYNGFPASTVYKVVPDDKLRLSIPDAGGLSAVFNSITVDDDGNPFAVGEYISSAFYLDCENNMWWGVGGTGLIDCSFKGVDYNPNDGRFYVAGYNGNWAWPVVYYTDVGPLTGGAKNLYYYQSTNFTPDCSLRSIAWNEQYNYGLAVGDEGHILKVWPYDYYGTGVMKYEEIGINGFDYYFDVSWDTDGWNEAGIVGSDMTWTDGLYYRYYHSNPTILFAHDSNDGTYYRSCAMKPPSSPKWLFMPTFSGGTRVNIMALDQSTKVSASTFFPSVYWVGFNDTAMNPMNNQYIDPNSTFYFTLEGNYTDGWNNVRVDIHAWYDDGWTGTNSNYPAETNARRNLAFNLTYEPASAQYTLNYPISPVLEVDNVSYSDTVVANHPVDPTQSIHRLELKVDLGAQLKAADGFGSMGIGPDYHSDPNEALDRANTWDFNVTVVDIGNSAKKNTTYGEFGVNNAVSVSTSGNPSGDAPPGSNAVYLGDSTITYSTNSNYWVNVSIPHLYLWGTPGPDFIDASNLQVQNTNSLATLPSQSDIPVTTYFPGMDSPLCVWGQIATGSLTAPANGTTAHGSFGSNYNLYGDPAGTTSVSWYVDVPVSLEAGSYTATITYSIEYEG